MRKLNEIKEEYGGICKSIELIQKLNISEKEKNSRLFKLRERLKQLNNEAVPIVKEMLKNGEL